MNYKGFLMRIQPVLNGYNYNSKAVKTQTQFESKNNSISQNKTHHRYTGVASVDLAYASMFDYSIAKDLKMMGLI